MGKPWLGSSATFSPLMGFQKHTWPLSQPEASKPSIGSSAKHPTILPCCNFARSRPVRASQSRTDLSSPPDASVWPPAANDRAQASPSWPANVVRGLPASSAECEQLRLQRPCSQKQSISHRGEAYAATQFGVQERANWLPASPVPNVHNGSLVIAASGRAWWPDSDHPARSTSQRSLLDPNSRNSHDYPTPHQKRSRSLLARRQGGNCLARMPALVGPGWLAWANCQATRCARGRTSAANDCSHERQQILHPASGDRRQIHSVREVTRASGQALLASIDQIPKCHRD